MLLAALPPPETIRQTTRQVISRPEYQVDAPSTSAVDVLETIERILRAIFGPFQRFAEWLNDYSPLLFWLLVVVMVLVVIALSAHIVWSFRQALARRVETISSLRSSRRALDPARLDADARAAAAREDYIGAVRLVFRACLVRLEAAEERALRLGMTNRELLRRYQNTPLADALRTFVETIDAKWYGHSSCNQQDYEACLQAQQVVSRHLREISARRAAEAARRSSKGVGHAVGA